jgi:hypothetical protein
MKNRRRTVVMLLVIGMLVLTGSCDLLTSEQFNDMKEVNLFKNLENIPFFQTEELLAHLRPYGPVQDGVVSFPETGSETSYRNVYSMRTAFTAAGLVIEAFSIVPDITEYIDKVQIMIVNDTLVEFEDKGGHTSDLVANLGKIRDKMTSLRTNVTTVGFSSSQVEAQVLGELDGIIAEAEEWIDELGGEVDR